MIHTKAKVGKKGNNLLVYIPTNLSKEWELHKGDVVNLDFENNELKITKSEELILETLIASVPKGYKPNSNEGWSDLEIAESMVWTQGLDSEDMQW